MESFKQDINIDDIVIIVGKSLAAELFRVISIDRHNFARLNLLFSIWPNKNQVSTQRYIALTRLTKIDLLDLCMLRGRLDVFINTEVNKQKIRR